jgi:DNA-binding NarL/FixJ family response regulator
MGAGTRLIRRPRVALLLLEDDHLLRDGITAMLEAQPHPTATHVVATLRSMSHCIAVPASSVERPASAVGISRAPRPATEARAASMTRREREVVTLLGEGLSNREIGVRLRIALHTVKTHVHNVLAKLALHSRLEIAAFAHRETQGC